MIRHDPSPRGLASPLRADGLQPRRMHFGRRALSPKYSVLAAQVAIASLVATTAFGTLGAIAFVATVALLVVLEPYAAGRDLLRFSPLLLLPVFAMVSTLWSDAPERSFRAALQLFLTCAAAVLICRRINATSMLLVLFLGFLVICLLMLPGAPAAFSRGLPLYSDLLGSKNQVGFAAHMLIALCLAVAVDRRQPGLARLATLPAVLLGLAVLFLAQSAGAKTSLAITLITFPAFMIFGRVKLSLRVAILLAALIAAGIALAFLPDLQAAWADFRVTVLKKDATLTGRTYLWDVAARLNAERPWLGRGYYAFWRHGNLEAEGLWRWGGIATRSGFNFHNAYIETQVDLGWIGAGLFVVTCAAIAALGCARQLMRPSAPSAFFLSSLIVLYLRGYAESGLIAPFSLLTMLWIAAAVYSIDGLRSMEAAKSKLGHGDPAGPRGSQAPHRVTQRVPRIK
jgi:exopolysaccharide production protein ExoQ